MRISVQICFYGLHRSTGKMVENEQAKLLSDSSHIHVHDEPAKRLVASAGHDRLSLDTAVRIPVAAGLWRSLYHTKPLFCQQASSHTGANLRCPHSNFHSQRSSIVFSSSLSISTTKLSSSPPFNSSLSSLSPHVSLALSIAVRYRPVFPTWKDWAVKAKWASLFEQFSLLVYLTLFLFGFVFWFV